MGRVFDWLDRKVNEAVRDYDIRINSLAAFHAGYAFFSLINYEEDIEAFHVYNVWNGEFNDKLVAALPSGGFMLHCDKETAYRLEQGNAGYPVFVKLRSKRGRLYVQAFCVTYADSVMDMYFNGCEVITPEYVYFRRYEEPGDAHYNEMPVSVPSVCINTSRIPSSYRHQGSMIRSSFSGFFRSSFSFMGGSFRSGSFRLGSLRLGSFRQGAFATGSFRTGSFGLSAFSHGSYRSGSFRIGSYFRGSFTGKLYNGSYYSGSYHKGSFVYGGGDGISRYENKTVSEVFPGNNNRYAVRRLIEELGYGLDLI